MSRWSDRAARGWLQLFFTIAHRLPWLLRWLKPPAVWFTAIGARRVRSALDANAARIHRRSLTPREARRFAQAVIGHFFEVVADMGRCQSFTREQFAERIGTVHGHERYLAARHERRGAVLVTAHMGSFEVGLASIMQFEPTAHVVFKRDPFPTFEAIRADLRKRLGVTEAAIDDGWNTLLQLRDALANDQVVLLQADRALPGQKAQVVPFLGGHLRLPVGPVTLARFYNSPIIPVFVIRTSDNRFDVHVAEPIRVSDEPAIDGVDPTLKQIAATIERFVETYPTQWLVLERAFIEDRPGEGRETHP